MDEVTQADLDELERLQPSDFNPGFDFSPNGAEVAEEYICKSAEKEDVGVQAVYMKECEQLVIFNTRLNLEDRSLSVSLE